MEIVEKTEYELIEVTTDTEKETWSALIASGGRAQD